MNFNEYRGRLRYLLKDSGTLWSDAELTECVKSAVDDLSRFLPLEKVEEITPVYTVTDESVTMPADADPDYVVDGATLNGESDGATLTISNTRINPARRLSVTLTDANYSVTQLTLIVKGYDQDGCYIEETWHLADLKVSGTAYPGKLYFSRIVEVELDNIGGSIAAGDLIDVGTYNAYDCWVDLANRPIRPQSETVTTTDGATTYTRNTDYYVDYINGRIKFINGGDMAAGTEYYIDYTKSRLGVDVSDLLPDITRIQRVEYPHDRRPQQFVSFNVIGDFLYIASKMSGQSQEEMTTESDDHIRIYYETKHKYPGEDGVGTYPRVLDDVVCTGASSYALMIKAIQYEHQAITDIAYVDTALDKIATEMASVDTELAAAGAVWTSEVKHILTASEPNMQDLLEAGDDFANALGNAADPAESYRRYAETAYLMARSWEQKRADLLTEASRYIDKANLWLGEGQARIANANQYLSIAASWKADAIDKRNEFWSILRDKSEMRKRVSSIPVQQPA